MKMLENNVLSWKHAGRIHRSCLGAPSSVCPGLWVERDVSSLGHQPLLYILNSEKKDHYCIFRCSYRAKPVPHHSQPCAAQTHWHVHRLVVYVHEAPARIGENLDLVLQLLRAVVCAAEWGRAAHDDVHFDEVFWAALCVMK